MSPSPVLLPAMLCHDDLYAPQTESLRDLVEARPLASLMASCIPNADLVVLDACGHLPTLEQPAAATKVARAWLERLEAAV